MVTIWPRSIKTAARTTLCSTCCTFSRLIVGLIIALLLYPAAICCASEPLREVKTIALPGVEGRIDHFAYDAANNTLFVAALGNNTVEVVDVAAGKVVKSIVGLREPQGVAFLADQSLVAVANGDDGACQFFDTRAYRSIESIDFQSDADNLRYDPTDRRLYVGFGNGALGVVDATSRKRLAGIKLSGHPESFQLEASGKRIFVNVPSAGHVAVVDREKSAVVAKWPLKETADNFPMALDEKHHRLFIGCRKPPRLLVLDTETGRTINSLDIVGDTDDVFYDASTKRIYVSGGEGFVTTIAQTDANSYGLLGKVATAPGARTSFFVADSRLLFVAVPHRGNQQAELRVFKAQ